MTHLTLSTGDVRESPRSEVSDSAIAALLPLARKGGGPVPGFSAFRVECGRGTGAATFSIHRGRDPIVMCGVCWDARGSSEVWDSLETLYLSMVDVMPIGDAPLPQRPSAVPWVVVVLLPGILTTTRDDLSWLGDFERCFAWTIAENEK